MKMHRVKVVVNCMTRGIICSWTGSLPPRLLPLIISKWEIAEQSDSTRHEDTDVTTIWPKFLRDRTNIL